MCKSCGMFLLCHVCRSQNYDVCCFASHPSQILCYPTMAVTRDGHKFSIHARRKYFARWRYDIVRVMGSTDFQSPWLARVQALFRVVGMDAAGDAPWEPLALIQWFDRDEDDVLPGMKTYALLPTVQVVHLDCIQRRVKMLRCPRVFEDGRPRYVAVPFGKTAVFNAL